MANVNTSAKALRALHKPGSPIVFANVYDAITANAVASLDGCRALATASYAVASAAGLEDNDLDFDTNLRAAKAVSGVAQKYNKPLSVDFQDGYGERLEEGIGKLIDLHVAGINLEDFCRGTGQMYSITDAADRVKKAMATASRCGVPDFVVNARVDTLVNGGSIQETIQRGQAYLAAGAANVFVWGGSKRGLSADEVRQLCRAFEGRLNVLLKLAQDGLSIRDLAEIGVARCSVGPTIQSAVAGAAKQKAVEVFNS